MTLEREEWPEEWPDDAATPERARTLAEYGEIFRCVHCGALAFEGDPASDGKLRCVDCGQGGLARHTPGQEGERTIAQRWTADIAACGFVATPDVLFGNLGILGLSHFDGVLLEALEKHRRGDASEEVRPSVLELARLVDRDPSRVRARLDAVRGLGLIERRARWSAQGRLPDAYTRHGLTAALDLIATNRRAGRPEEEGLGELLDDLAHKAHARKPGAGNPGRANRAESSTSASPNRSESSGGSAQNRALDNRSESSREAEAVNDQKHLEAESTSVAPLDEIERGPSDLDAA